jgi:hypothetical protein
LDNVDILPSDIQAQRNENSAAMKIQSLVRGHLARAGQRRKVRRELEGLQQAVLRGEVGRNINKEQIFEEVNLRNLLIFQPFTTLEFCLCIVGLLT